MESWPTTLQGGGDGDLGGVLPGRRKGWGVSEWEDKCIWNFFYLPVVTLQHLKLWWKGRGRKPSSCRDATGESVVGGIGAVGKGGIRGGGPCYMKAMQRGRQGKEVVAHFR